MPAPLLKSPIRLAGAILIPMIGLACYLFPFADSLLHLSYDLPFLFFKRTPPPEIVLVYIDEKSAHDLNQDPGAWDRALHTKLLERLTADGASLVYYDIFFAEEHPGTDDDLAKAMRKNGNVILGASYQETQQGAAFLQTPLPPTQKLLDAAAGWGLILFTPDPDYAARRLSTDYLEIPSASWVAATRLGAPLPHDLPKNAAPIWLNYYGPAETFRSVSFSQALLKDGVPPDFFKGKIVLVGGRPTA